MDSLGDLSGVWPPYGNSHTCTCTARQQDRKGEGTEEERRTKRNPTQYFRSVTSSIRENGFTKNLAEQKETKHKIILE